MTVEKMLAGQRIARNHIIVEVLRDYGYVDARGMGVRAKVVPALKASGAQWQVEATDDFVKTTVGKATTSDPVAQKHSISGQTESEERRENVGKTSGKILYVCRQRPSITIPELAQLIGITERSVQRSIQSLQKDGLLRRVGGRKEGHWEVTHEGA
jgi:ATP-dependent DNA helicase RecG